MENIQDPEFRRMLAERMRGLADPTRIHLLHLLMEGEKCVHELATLVERSQATVSKHLAILTRCGFIRPAKKGVQTFFTIKNDELKTICHLMCNALRDQLNEMASAGTKKGR